MNSTEQSFRVTRIQFWLKNIFTVVVFGAIIGFASQHFIETPPYVYLILSQNTEQHSELIAQTDSIHTILSVHGTELNKIDGRLNEIESRQNKYFKFLFDEDDGKNNVEVNNK